MENEERMIQKYIDEKKELQKLILQILNKTDSDDNDFQNLFDFLDKNKYEKNKPEVEHFLRLISTIADNHHRQSNFFTKIEKILSISSKFYQSIFSSEELFSIFQQSRPILLFLLKTQIITIDEKIFNYLLNFALFIDDEISYYFYPELNSIIKSGKIDGINYEYFKSIMKEEDIENFEINRQNFENMSRLCSIIREDLIEDFIQYVHQWSISLKSQIRPSIFETNSILIENEPTLIEYATFFGSIRIINYLEINNVELTPSIWLYAVHSNNPEVIQFLEEKNIEMDDRTFSEAVKCHHNDIANYIYYNYLNNSSNITKISDLSDESVFSIYSSNNYEFFQYEIDENKIFFSLCQNNYIELVDFHLKTKKEEFENYFNVPNMSNEIIYELLKELKLDAVYYLLLKFDSLSAGFFHYNKQITKIALPPTIKSISNDAFTNCLNLMYISIPSSVTSIGSSAFYSCKSLKEITIPSSITTIPCYAFFGCSSLTTIKFSAPSSLTSISDFSFCCSSLKSILIPPTVTLIGSSAFNGCKFLKQVVIPSSVNKISSYAFNICSSLTYIKIPYFVKEISDCSFRACSLLTQISLPSSVSKIGGGLFADCPNLNKISIYQCKEKRIEMFEDKFLVFKSDSKSENYDTLIWVSTKAETVIVPSFIKTIIDSACWCCKSLKCIEIPSSVTSIGDYMFYECSSLEKVVLPPKITQIGTSFFLRCSSLSQIEIPSSVNSIGQSAFKECSSLKQIEIPSSVKEIKPDAFSLCTSLTQISIPRDIYNGKLSIPSNAKVITF